MATAPSENTPKPNAANSMTIKLMVSKKSRKILYAEAGKDFVDLLFSFLILPTGSIAKHLLLSKVTKEEDQAKACCITNLYKSVESLSASLMKGDKAVLLDPKVVSTTYTTDILHIQSPSPPPPLYAAPPRYYVCNNAGSTSYTHSLSTQSGASTCACGNYVNREVKLVESKPPPVAAKDTVHTTGYVKKSANFVVTDDLTVIPVNSTATIVQLWNKLDVKEPTELEERNVTVGPNEVMGLLKASMASNTALNDVFKAQPKYSAAMEMDTAGISVQELLIKLLTEGQKNRSSSKKEKQHRIAMAADQSETTAKPKAVNSMAIKLMVNKRSGKIMYAEAGKDFVDLLLSFLVLPTGAIVKQALVSKDTKEKDDTKVCCITNLYKSVESLSSSLMKSDKAVLLDPKVVSTTYTNDILRIESPSPATPPKYYVCSNASNNYYSGGYYTSTHNLSTQNGTVTCSCGSWLNREVKLVDKAPVPVPPTGFVKKSANFVITDDLNIIPVNSTATIVQLWTKLDVKEPTELEERNATVGPNEVVGLLKAAMVSKTTLNDVFKAQPKFSATMDMDTTGISLQELLIKLLTEGQKNRSSNKMAN